VLYIPIKLTVCFDRCENSYKFTIDTDFQCLKYETENIRHFKVFVNDIETVLNDKFIVKEGDEIKIKGVTRYNVYKDSKIIIEGFKYTETYNKDEVADLKDIIHC
jgi:hypothetical protein